MRRNITPYLTSLKRMCLSSVALAALAAMITGQLAGQGAAAQSADLAQTLSPTEARTVLTRTSFGASPADLTQWVGQPRQALVEELMNQLSSPSPALPASFEGWSLSRDALYLKSQALAELSFGLGYLQLEEMTASWIAEMIAGDSPFQEQLTLFWTDHFVTSFDKMEAPVLQAHQHQTLRDTMGGNFQDMLQAQLTDPLMLNYLDNVENVKGAPNENLARELLELFTLGRDRGYSEEDIRQVARALTGHGFSEFDRAYAFYAGDHDNGAKTIFGQTANFDAPDLPQLIVSQDAFGPYIVEKLWQWFISPQPDADQVAAITATWRASNWDMPTLYRALLSTPGFWDPANAGTLVKSPVELLVGTGRTFGLKIDEPELLVWASEGQGQNLFFPPNVAGWTEGNAWITDNSLMLRTAMLSDWATSFENLDASDLAQAPELDQTAPPFVETQDLRVGFAAVEWAGGWTDAQADATSNEEAASGSYLSMLTMDVGLGGQTYRGLGFDVAADNWGDEREYSLVFYADACGQTCPLADFFARSVGVWDDWQLEEDDREQALWISQWDISANAKMLNQRERGFLASLTAALPQLINDTKHDDAWKGLYADEVEEGERLLSFDEASSVIRDVSRNLADIELFDSIKPAPLSFGFSQPQGMGVPQALVDTILSADSGDQEEIFSMLEEDYEDGYGSPAVQAAAARVNQSASGTQNFADWVAALPVPMQNVAAVTDAVLAVPTANTPSKSAVTDASGLITALVTDPRYNLK